MQFSGTPASKEVLASALRLGERGLVMVWLGPRDNCVLWRDV